IIRHPDMPRAVFHLLWHTIGQGQPIGAFVKNRARDGLHYWVFAIVTPVKGGYLSVRMKPTSDLRDIVEDEYGKLLALETSDNLDPTDSGQLLLRRLGELGFPTYGAFMAKALSTEFVSRCRRLGREPDPKIEQFEAITEAITEVAAQTTDLSDVFQSIRGIPYNMRILASRLEAAGGPISVISANYGVLSEEISNWMTNFVENTSGSFGDIKAAVETGLFMHCTSLIQEEMTAQFRSERGLDSHIHVANEIDILHRQTDELRIRATDGMRQVARQAERFSQSVRDMKRLITGLGATRMMCKIEGARLKNAGDSLSGVINQLDTFQDSIEERLSKIDDLNRIILRNAALLLGEGTEAVSETPKYATA
ncbi:MAG: chemotaxis protein, partial [Pseudomonadota bacterium]